MDDDPSKVAIPPGQTRLVLSSDQAQVLTYDRETDCRNALTRGMAEYINQLSTVYAGRQLAFAQVFEDWAESDDDADFPGAVVYTTSEGMYDQSELGPTPLTVQLDDGTGRYIRQYSEFSVDVKVECWFNDEVSRRGIMMMLEDAFCPVDFMYGFRLALPHYFGVHATFEPLSSVYLDTADRVNRRWIVSSFTLRGNVPQVRQVGKIPSANFINETTVETG